MLNQVRLFHTPPSTTPVQSVVLGGVWNILIGTGCQEYCGRWAELFESWNSLGATPYMLPLFNSMAPGSCGSNVVSIIFKLFIRNSILGTRCDIALQWMPQNLTNKSTFVQIKAWCHMGTSQYLSQCWQTSVSPYDHHELRGPMALNTYIGRQEKSLNWCDSDDYDI